MEEVRLDKFLANEGAGTRSQVKQYLKAGRVRVNGQACIRPEQKVDPRTDQIELDGRRVSKTGPLYFLLNKPGGCITATRGAGGKNVLDLLELLPEQKQKLFPVGRLDKDTEGLLLLTDDGELAHRLLSPRHHVEKTYEALVSGTVGEEQVRAFARGLDIGDEKPTLPARLWTVGQPESRKTAELPEATEISGQFEKTVTRVRVTIREGRYHQVRRMFQAVGCQVLFLKRISMGTLVLPETLPLGAWRPLSPKELADLRTCAYDGGRSL